MRADVLIFPFELLSHYSRSCVFAREHLGGSSIRIQSSARYNRIIQEFNFSTFEADRFNSDYVMSLANRFDFSWLSFQEIEKIFLSQVEAIKTFYPHTVVGDTSPTLRMAAEYAEVKYVALMNGYMTKYHAITRQIPTVHPAYPLTKILPAFLLNKLTELGESKTFKAIHEPFRRLRAKYGLKQTNNYLDELEGDDNLICDLPALFPQKMLPANYHFISPLIYRPQSHATITYHPYKPNIIVTLGSSGNWDALRILNENRFSKYHFISAGDSHHILNADHITSYEFVDLTLAMKKIDLMICHGGNGTIYHGILNSVPILCLTDNFEQEWNVHALVRAGYGQSINRRVDKLDIIMDKALQRSSRQMNAQPT